MLPELTEAQKEQDKKQLTTPEYQDLKITNAKELKQFYIDFLDAYADALREAACEECIPPWLLASIIMGEVTAMDTYFGIDERTLEEMGLGDSVGLAQITVDTALKYDLTETAKNEDKVRNFVANRVGQLISREAIAAEWLQNPLDSLDCSAPPPNIQDPYSPDVTEFVRLLIRWELLNPLSNIKASAGYLRELIDQAKGTGKIENYTADGSEPWHEFNFERLSDRDIPIWEASCYPTKEERMKGVAELFGAGHNDDSLSGFKKGYGLTQGENAGYAADDLIRFDLIEEYDLDDCP